MVITLIRNKRYVYKTYQGDSHIFNSITFQWYTISLTFQIEQAKITLEPMPCLGVYLTLEIKCLKI